ASSIPGPTRGSTPKPKGGAQCGSPARWDLRGGRLVTGVPTAILGHSTIAITMDRYGHLMPGSESEAAGLLDAYLARADTAARVAQLG
ncbi:MAG: hypothetical protein ACYCUM_14405, partial [Solirubrobacteraceae bacterium]